MQVRSGGSATKREKKKRGRTQRGAGRVTFLPKLGKGEKKKFLVHPHEETR